MKPLITTYLALCAVACGSGGQAPDFHAAVDQTPPANRYQLPERPRETVPPLSSQLPPTNSQTPPLSSQTPPLSSQTPPLGSLAPGRAAVGALTCAAAVAAVNGAGCTVSASDIEDCGTWSALGSPCAAAFQSLLACLTTHAVCDGEGRLDANASCPDQFSAVETCMTGYEIVQPAVCSKETQCRDCVGACARCLCREDYDATRCDNEC